MLHEPSHPLFHSLEFRRWWLDLVAFPSSACNFGIYIYGSLMLVDKADPCIVQYRTQFQLPKWGCFLYWCWAEACFMWFDSGRVVWSRLGVAVKFTIPHNLCQSFSSHIFGTSHVDMHPPKHLVLKRDWWRMMCFACRSD